METDVVLLVVDAGCFAGIVLLIWWPFGATRSRD